MHLNFFVGSLIGGVALGHATLPAVAFDTLQVPTSRGNVPLYVPSTIEPGTSLPLVVSLHGYTGNGTEHENYFNLRSQVDGQQFMLCVPEGTQNFSGDRFWNATDVCCGFGVDDSGYLRGLIETIIAEQPVDLDSIHVTGHSNGGFMSYRMACDHADLVASVASLAGATYYYPSFCTPDQPVHVLQVHGTQDDVVQYGDSCFGFICIPGALRTVRTWADYGQCADLEQPAGTLDLVGNLAGAETDVLRIDQDCETGGSAELWTINGGNHGPSFNGNFRRELVAWLLEHRRGELPPCPADLDGNRLVDGGDLSLLISSWDETNAALDLDGDGSIGGGDLAELLADWGSCDEPG